MEISQNHGESMSFIQNKTDKKDNFQIGHPNQQMNFISNRRSNLSNNLAPSNNQNIMYGQDAPTGAQTKQKNNL